MFNLIVYVVIFTSSRPDSDNMKKLTGKTDNMNKLTGKELVS